MDENIIGVLKIFFRGKELDFENFDRNQENKNEF